MSSIDQAGNVHKGAGQGGGQFAHKHQSQPEVALGSDTADLTTQTPSQIDEQLAELYYTQQKLFAQADAARSVAESYRKRLERPVNDYDRNHFEDTVARHDEMADSFIAAARTVARQMKPFRQEERRRGGWNRAYLVTGGHLHNSMACSTCNRDGKRTRFAWMTEFSGASESEMVEAAGDRCCTVCFPSAPVEVLARPSTLLTADEKEAAEARAAREAERARKAAERDAKAITNPDGTPLREPRKYGREAKTLVTAERELTDALLYTEVDQRYRHSNPEFLAEQREWATMLITAIAAKKGISEDEARATGIEKAKRKLKRRNY